MNKLVYIIMVFGILLVISCGKDDDGKTPIDTTIDCNTITYSGNISSMINSNCATAGCHNGGALGDFSTHAGLVGIATDGKMASRVLTIQDMPPAGGLTSLQLGQIQCWINAGAPDN